MTFLLSSILVADAGCPVPELPCMGGGLDGLVTMVADQIPEARLLFYALLAIMLMVYAITLIVQSTNGESVDQARKAFTFALMGSAVVSFMYEIFAAVNPWTSGLIDAAQVLPLAVSAREYIKIIAGAAAVGFVTVRAIRLAMAGGDEGQAQSQRKLFLNAIFGVGIVVMSSLLVNAALPGGGGILEAELQGIAYYVMFILGALIVLGIVVGAALLILSYDEGLKDRAKKSIYAGLIVLLALVLVGGIIALI